MSGLLDKATAAKDAKPAKSEKVDPAPSTSKVSSPVSQGLMAASSPAPGNPVTDYLQTAGWVIIVLAGVLSLRGGEMGPLIVSVVALIGVGCLVQYERMKPELSTIKIGVSVAVALIVALGPLAAIAIIPSDSSMALTQIEVNQETDEITFFVRGSFDSSKATISLDGEELWSGTKSLNNDFAKFRVPISEFFEGNSQNNFGDTINEYVISVEARNGQTETRTITPGFLNREVLQSGSKITMVTKTTTTVQGNSGTTETVVDGVLVESIVGLFGSSESTEDGGEHSMSTVTNYLPVFSDYTIQLKVLKGNSLKWTSPMMTVDGDTATWEGLSGATETASIDRWMGLPGTGTDEETKQIEILKRDDFFDGDGCYTFQLIVTNEYYSGDSAVQTSNNAWDLSWDSDEQNSEMTAC
jgi:hypothetical protein